MKKRLLFLTVFISFINFAHGYENRSPFLKENSTLVKKEMGAEGGPAKIESESGPDSRVLDVEGDEEEFREEIEGIPDPLEPFNRAMFTFNDKLYFWILKPVARGYRKIVPQEVRTSIRRCYANAATPVRLVNCALQGKVTAAVTESERFLINGTLGLGGFFDPAQSFFHLKEREADFDQTLGILGMQPVIYINWPILGPSSLRGTLGLVADTGCDPSTYLLSPLIKFGIAAYEELNETSLTLGEYEDVRDSALDPYIAIRDAYFQNRKSKIESK